MGLFAMRSRQAPARPEAGGEPLDLVSRGVPPRFEAVGEALASGQTPDRPCAVLGQAMARDGISLDEALEGLRVTARLVTGRDPDFASTRALSAAWGEETMGYVHQMSCEEPLSGLCSLAHLRSRLAELHRAADARQPAESVRDRYALIVVELLADADEDSWGRTLRLSSLGETARTVFPGDEPIGRLGLSRLAVVAPREHNLGARVSLLRRMAATADQDGARVWIEGLPTSDYATAALLDELARG